jgi:hypothetical protein
MLTNIIPKLPMRSKAATREFYLTQLGFTDIGGADFEGYLLVKKDNVEIHFFEFKGLEPKENYGQVYIRTNDIETLYQSMLDNNNSIHPKTMQDILFDFISKYISLTEDEKNAILSLDIFRSVKKGTILLKEGQKSKEEYFVLKGCIRKYYIHRW